MSSGTPERDPDTDGRDHQDAAVVRATYLAAGSGLGAVVLLTALSSCGSIGGTATAGITATGTITTAAFGVAALYLRRRR
ncbi:hypothetical protein GCM10027290_61370 [Micromonospora sonneratiae]|uniref:Lipoprotein n=1 Tax=Micromonospora sonneratiae TaxID=1184706 RepID=A0ABW3YNB0_9ACTN